MLTIQRSGLLDIARTHMEDGNHRDARNAAIRVLARSEFSPEMASEPVGQRTSGPMTRCRVSSEMYLTDTLHAMRMLIEFEREKATQ